MEKIYRIQFLDAKGHIYQTKFYQSLKTYTVGLNKAIKSDRIYKPTYKTYVAKSSDVKWE